jgi:hypothetical protein
MKTPSFVKLFFNILFLSIPSGTNRRHNFSPQAAAKDPTWSGFLPTAPRGIEKTYDSFFY